MENRPSNQDITYNLIVAVREGNLERTTDLINSYGLAYSQEWSQGYDLLRDALRNKHAAVAKLLLTNGAEVNSKIEIPLNTPLHFAVMNDDIDIVKMILDKGANVDAENLCGETPLHIAAERGYLQIVEHLVDNGAYINCVCTGRKNYTPLHVAVERDDTEVTTLLLSRGVNIDVKGKNGMTPLHVAAKNGNIRIAKDLLNHGACIDSPTLKEGFTPLHFASELDDEEAVELFLGRGADVNATTEDDSTPLHIATKGGREKVVKLLLQHGAEVDNKDENGKTTLQLAVEKGNSRIVEEILKYCPDINDQSNRISLKIAVSGYGEEDEEIIKALLEYGFIVDSENANDLDFLHAAVEKGYLKIVEDLLKYGADINASDKYGRTALHFTAKGVADDDSAGEIAKLLLSKGAHVNAQTKYGETALHAAIENEYIKVVEALLEYNANVNHGDKCDVTPLHIAARKNKKMSIMLLNKGARMNARCRDGDNALSIATNAGNKDIVEVLLERGAKFDCIIENDSTLLHLAAESGYTEIIESLLEFGANPNSRDEYGRTALYIASEEGYHKVVATLLEHGSDINITSRYNDTPLDCVMARIRSFADDLENDGDDDHFYQADHPFFGAFGVVAETLKRHIVKMKTANLYVSEQNLLLISNNDGMSNFQDECEEEIARMKSEAIDNANVSFYDILAKDAKSIARCMRNENIVQVSKLDTYKTKFPIYAGMIENNFKNGMKKKELLKQGNESFHILFNNSFKLLPECVDKIINYFSDEDLRNLIEACKPLGINDPNANDVVIS